MGPSLTFEVDGFLSILGSCSLEIGFYLVFSYCFVCLGLGLGKILCFASLSELRPSSESLNVVVSSFDIAGKSAIG